MTQAAHQTVLHGAQYPSALVLPIIPALASGKASTTFPMQAHP